MPLGLHHPIPNLFPDSLEQCCTNVIIRNLFKAGIKIEREAKRRKRSKEVKNVDCVDHFDLGFVDTDFFVDSVNEAREYLVSFLASNLLDKLSSSMTAPRAEGGIFTFSVVCNDRLSQLVVHQNNDDATFWSLNNADLFMIDCLHQLRGLSSLTIQKICTNEMLEAVAETCSRLQERQPQIDRKQGWNNLLKNSIQTLDISYSSKVTDIGLVYLCGVSPSSCNGLDHFNRVRGCKFLREFHFFPQTDADRVGSESMVMPKVISYLLKHLTQLQVADLENLHAGIEYYYKGGQDGSYRPRPGRIPPLKLRFYSGSDDKLAEVISICPKLSNFKLFVTGALQELSEVLKTVKNSLDKISLVFESQDRAGDQTQRIPTSLPGLSPFLQSCGYRINSLEIDFSASTETNRVSVEDFLTISQNCPLLESLSMSKFLLDQPIEAVPALPIKLNFLTTLRLSDFEIETCGREFFLFVLGGCQDLETLSVSFRSRTFYFNDFFLDDILLVNSFARLEQFLISEVSMTLISALRMISNRPKLRSLGHLLQWDVEVCELDAFAQILRKAKSLNLLQDISIL